MNNDRFKSLVAVLIAFVTILGATVACLATVALSRAGDKDFAGMSAAINAQKAQIINHVNAYEHYRAYTAYARYMELGAIMQGEASQANAEKAAQLSDQQQEAWGLASSLSQSFFSPRYMNKDGYNIQRELGELWADASERDDLEFKSHFEQADSFRTRSSFLFADMIVFAVSFWFFTLAQVIENRWKYLFIGVGVFIALGGILGILIAEVF